MVELTAEEQRLAAELPPSEWGAAAHAIEAWYMDDSEEDQRLPHRLSPNQPCPAEALHALGVRVWVLDADKYESGDPQLAAIRKVRGYSYEDSITCTPQHLPNYEEKIKSFYEEHLHTDEEIRYILDGSGYFDVRDLQDRWIRIWTRKGALLVVPEGIYHRFTLDTNNYIKALRLFVGVPVWTPINRPAEDNPSRVKYLTTMGQSVTAAA